MKSQYLRKILDTSSVHRKAHFTFNVTQDVATNGVAKLSIVRVPFKMKITGGRCYMVGSGTLTTAAPTINKYTLSVGDAQALGDYFKENKNAALTAYTGAGAVVPGLTVAQTASSELLKVAVTGTAQGVTVQATLGANYIAQDEGVVNENDVIGCIISASGDTVVGTIRFEIDYVPVD